VDYFSELIFGARYNMADTLDVRLAIQLDGTGDNPPGAEQGTSFLYGLGLPVLGTFVPGLSLWVDGAFRGLGGDPYEFYTIGIKGDFSDTGYTTKNAVKIGFESGDFSASAKAAFETWKDLGTVFAIKPSASYQLFPWLKPGVEAEFYIRSYEDDIKTTYKGGTTEDPAGFDRLYFKVYAEMGLGNGFTLTPSFALTSHTKYGTFGESHPYVPVFTPGTTLSDNRIDTTVGISLSYSF
jgi:hypothetical protein